jgi:ACR3 family arsenite transporter
MWANIPAVVNLLSRVTMCANSQGQVEGSSNRASHPFDAADEHPEVHSNVPKGLVPRLRTGRETITDQLPVLFQRLGILDRLLTPLILISMVVGVVIGEFVPGVQPAFDTVQFYGVSVREQSIHFPQVRETG